MGWDDSDDDEWDVDDAEVEARLAAQLKEKERLARREAGEESEDEDDEPTPKAAPQPGSGQPKPGKPKPKAKKKQQQKPEEPEPVLDSQAEKLRRRQLELEADDRLADDLFSGCAKASDEIEKEEAEARKKREAEDEAERIRKAEAAKPKIVVVDQFDQVELNVQNDVEKMSEQCLDKLNKGKAKDANGKFLCEMLKALEPDLSFKELTEVEKLLADLLKGKKADKGATQAKENKANTKLSKTTKFDAAGEWEEYYGQGDGGEDWTAEEWEEWEKQQAAAWEKSQGKK